MPRIEYDVAIVGAGVAGLAATGKLKAAGKEVVCLEAGSRIGGRILTLRDPLAPIPIELGAEFVHGLPPQTWELIRQTGLVVYEHAKKAIHLDHGRVLEEKKVVEVANRVLEGLVKSRRKKDESFADYLHHSHYAPEAKKWAALHIEGFNAARQERISAASLKKDADAADDIDGDRAFHILNGYDSIPAALLRSIPDPSSVIHLNSVVKKVKWKAGSVEVRYQQRFNNEECSLRCRKLVVTVPLGVLQARGASRGAIRFDPEPKKILAAASAIEFGQVYRVAFRFATAFWEEQEKLKDAGFLISQDKAFSTWWTIHPVIAPILTAWCAGSAADQFDGMKESQIAEAALASLGRILKRKIPPPEAVYFHDWQADPFFRGAYSYAPVNALSARRALAKPVQDTLYFAGEATDYTGNASTVHGAIASGIRVADLIVGS